MRNILIFLATSKAVMPTLIKSLFIFSISVKKNPDIMEEIRTPQERAAAALHISAATIGKIGKNFKKTGKLETPGES